MKRLLLILCALVAASSLWAQDFTAVAPDGNTYAYTITSDTEPRTVSISCANADYKKIVIPEAVTNNEFTYSVTGILLFSSCKSLTSVIIPESVKNIEGGAFRGTGLTSIIIPNSIDLIPSGTFKSCTVLTSATIPTSVKSIGAEAFAQTGLSSITIPSSVKSIGNKAFFLSRLSTITLPASVTSIEDYAFGSCHELQSFTCLGSIATVGKQILTGDTALKSVKAPAEAFSDINDPDYNYTGSQVVSNLENITITNGELTSDGLDAIRQSYRSLKSIDMAQASNTALPDVALENCYKLEQLVLPSGLETIGYKSFAECVMLKKVNVPASVTVVGDRAFENCRRMDTLTFGSALKASSALQVIGNWAFYNCHNLKSLIVPEGVTEIGLAAFYGCSYVEQLTLPSSLLKIGDNSFALCSSLKSITVLAEAPPVIEAQTFYDVNRAIPVLVPESTIGLYAIDTYWSEFVGIAATDPTTNPTTGLADASVRPYRISVENGELVIDNPTNLPVSVYDMQGRSVGTSVAPLLTNGLYIVKIGDFTETIQ